MIIILIKINIGFIDIVFVCNLGCIFNLVIINIIIEIMKK